MKKVLFLLALLLSVLFSKGQDVRGTRVIADQGLFPGVYDTVANPGRIGEMRMRAADTTIYFCIKVTAGGKRWEKVAKGSSAGVFTGWDLTGNTGINPTTNFLGTTDAQPLIARTNDIERMRVLSGGNVGINTTTPSYLLDVNGKIGIGDGTSSIQFGYLPNKITFPNSLFIGTGGNMLGAGPGDFDGQNNLGIGIGALDSVISGYNNTVAGLLAGNRIKYGIQNTIFGTAAGAYNVWGGENAYFGTLAAWKNRGSFGVAVGNAAMLNCDTCETYVSIGASANRLTLTGNQFNAIGYRIWDNNNEIHFSNGMGYRFAQYMTYALSVTGMGQDVLGSASTGIGHTAVGAFSAYSLTGSAGRNSTFYGIYSGTNALQKTNPIHQNIFGSYAYGTRDFETVIGSKDSSRHLRLWAYDSLQANLVRTTSYGWVWAFDSASQNSRYMPISSLSGGATPIKISDTLRYTIVTNYGADPAGVVGSAAYIQAAINGAVTLGYNACYIPPGRYKIEGVDSAIILPANFTLFGVGEQSELFTTTNGATTNLTTTFNFIELPNARGTVRDLKFTGNGKTTYVFPWTTQNGIWAYGSFSTIQNIRGHNLRGSVVMGVHPSLTGYTGGNIANLRADTCTVGVFTYTGSEYWTMSNIQAIGNDIGVNEWGANNGYSNSEFSYNRINGQFQGTGGNSDHSYVNNCWFNHGTANNLNIDNITLSLTFTGGGSWSASSTVDQSVGVSFNNFQWGTLANLTVTASSTDKYTILNNCFRSPTSAPVFTESGTGKIMDIAPFNSSISTFNINKGVQFTGLPAGPGTRAVRIDASGNLSTLDTASAGWAINGNVLGADGKWVGSSDNFDFTVKTNNTSRINVLKTGELGVGTAGFTGYKYVQYSTGTNASTVSTLLRDLGGSNLWVLNDLGSTVQGKGSTSLHNFIGKVYAGDGVTTPTAKLHIAAGTATASTAPLKFTSGTNLTTVENGAVEYNGSRLFVSSNGTRQNVLQGVSGSFSGVGTATTVFTVTFGGTQPNATYQVNVTPTAALSAALFYVTNKTTTTFDVTYLAGLTGTVTFDWSIYQ